MLRWTVGFFAAAGFLVSTTAVAQQVTTGQNISITLHGIISGSMFMQDADFGTGNAQKAEYVTAERNAWVHGGDVRNTRLSLALAGPEVASGWHANATVELDFFGAYSGGGNFGDEQPQARLRLAYVDLAGARTTLRIGQDFSPTFGTIPQSTSHIGYPLGWGSGGFIGWRFTQIKLMHTLSRPGAKETTKMQLAVMNGSWTDEAGGTNNTFSAGERSAPQAEARFDYSAGRLAAYVVGHIDTKDFAAGPNLVSRALEIGFSTTRGGVSIAVRAVPLSHVVETSRLAHHIGRMSRKEPKRSGRSDQNKAIARWDNEGGAPKGAPQEDRNESLTNEEEHILRCLGAAVIMQWNDLPTKIKRELFEHASSMGENHTAELEGQLARFLHQHKDDGRESA